MPYIGNSLATQFQAFVTQTITGDGSTGYTLDRAVANGKELLVYINNVKQEEGSGKSYTASGTTIAFSEAVASTDSCYVVYLGSAVQTVAPPDGSLASYTGNASISGTLGVTGAVTANAGISVDNINIDGTEIDLSSGDLTIDVAGDIILDADGGDFQFKDDGTHVLNIENSSGDIKITSITNDKDIIFRGVDNSSAIDALTLDMSDGGKATFRNGISLSDGDLTVASGHGIDFSATSDGTTMSSELLDDYEEGTWTPAIVGTSNTPTFFNQVGRYTKIGRSVTVQCFLQTQTAPTYSNTATQFKISGVPFNLLAIGYTGGQGVASSQALSYVGGDNDNNAGASTGGGTLTCGINADEQLIFHVTGSGQSRGSVENSGTTSGFILEATLTYFTDA